jgi:protein SCO1/2
MRDLETKSSDQWAVADDQWIVNNVLRVLYFLFFTFCPLLLVVSADGHEDSKSILLSDISIEQRLNEQIPLDLVFRDEVGQTVRLGNYFDSKPVILVLSYYECPMLCPVVLEDLVSSLRVLAKGHTPFYIGDQFTIVTISFDPGETPPLAASKKEKYIQGYARPEAAKGWHFLTGEEASIKYLTQAVGFKYTYDVRQDQYAHAGGIIILTPQGRIARYFYGIEFSPKELRLSLVEASENKIGSVVDQILLLCYHYDPATGRYSVTILNIIRLGGAMTVFAIGTFIFVMRRREKIK